MILKETMVKPLKGSVSVSVCVMEPAMKMRRWNAFIFKVISANNTNLSGCVSTLSPNIISQCFFGIRSTTWSMLRRYSSPPQRNTFQYSSHLGGVFKLHFPIVELWRVLTWVQPGSGKGTMMMIQCPVRGPFLLSRWERESRWGQVLKVISRMKFLLVFGLIFSVSLISLELKS